MHVGLLRFYQGSAPGGGLAGPSGPGCGNQERLRRWALPGGRRPRRQGHRQPPPAKPLALQPEEAARRPGGGQANIVIQRNTCNTCNIQCVIIGCNTGFERLPNAAAPKLPIFLGGVSGKESPPARPDHPPRPGRWPPDAREMQPMPPSRIFGAAMDPLGHERPHGHRPQPEAESGK